MSIQFKFRSSVNFDSVQIDGQVSISVRDLRSKIVRHKNLNISQDFDLVFSDALTGHEYKDEDYQIPSGSSVIIKRVPAGTVPSTIAHVNFGDTLRIKDSKLTNTISNAPLLVEDDLDDFGDDLCPTPQMAIFDSVVGFDKHKCFSDEKPNNAPRIGSQKLEASDLSEASPIDPDHHAMEGKFQMPVQLKGEECMKPEKMDGAHCTALRDVNLPSELKCSLCNTYFKEAVMIPCCQHSFCKKCIFAVLIEKARCPKCFSSKCKVGDLLPNLSLRQAIERFLESQFLLGDEDKDLHKDAPDGESGIQAKDYSHAVTIPHRELKVPVSPSATENGSNQIIGESAYESRVRNNVPGSRTHNLVASKALNSVPSFHKLGQINGERVASDQNCDLEPNPNFQGKNRPHNVYQRHMHEEGGDRFVGTGRYNKGDRTCYMCGSPNHFIRDCPLASEPQAILPSGNIMFPGAMPGYGSPFWNRIPVAPVRPFSNIYRNFGMLPFNATMIPAPPYAVPPYMPSIYGGHMVPSAYMRMGDMSCFAPQDQASFKHHLNTSETSELRYFENRWRMPDENMRSGRSYDDDGNEHLHSIEPERSHKYKVRDEREKSANHFEDSFTHRSPKRRHDDLLDHDRYTVKARDRSHPRPPKRRSDSGADDVSFSSDKRREGSYRTLKNHERKDLCGSDSSRSCHESKIKKCVGKKRGESDIEPSSSVDQRKHYKDKDLNPISRHSRHDRKPIGNDLCEDRWQMASGSNEDHVEAYHSHKRKRVH